MDIGRAFGFVFQDQQWLRKVLIGGLIMLIPLVGQFVVIGYMIKVAQNVAQGRELPLPEWGEFTDHLVRGFYAFLIQLVYLLPAAILYFIAIAATGVGAAATTNSDGTGGAGSIIGLCLLPLAFLAILASSVVAYAALGRFAATNTLSEGFKFSEVIANLRTYAGPWLLFILIVILAGLVAQVGLIACGIGLLFTFPYSQMITGHALGQTLGRVGFASPNPYATQPVPPSYTPPPTYQ